MAKTPPDETLGFGRELRELRQERSITQDQLAAAARLSPTYVRDLEHGRRGNRPSLAIIEQLAGALGVEADRFRIYRAKCVLYEWPQAIDYVYAQMIQRRNGAV